jgi:hypothetical protein
MKAKHTSGPPQLSGTKPLVFKVVGVDANHLMTVQMGINFANAEVPERSYYADYCDVQQGRVSLELTFGKLVTGQQRLRTKIEISYPEALFVSQLWASSTIFHEGLRKAARPLEPLSAVEDTDKVQTFRASIVFMGVWGEDAVLDFYYVSPKDLGVLMAVGQEMNVGLEPVVRVAMGNSLLYEFLEKCKPFVEGRSDAAKGVLHE